MCCALRVWCSVPLTHIPERPPGSFPMAGRARGGPDLDPSPCLAACPCLDAGTQRVARGCASVYPPAAAVCPYFWAPETTRAGEGPWGARALRPVPG